jgi:hypothetical protein
MKKLCLCLCLILLFVACGEEKTEVVQKHQPKHQVERLAFQFIKDLKADKYKDEIYFFEADTEFTYDDRVDYFRRLEKFIRNNDWNLYYTIVDMYDGVDDFADVILKSKSGDLLVLCYAYWYDTERWELDAYEFPGLTFDRPADQLYEDYVQEIIDDAKEIGVPYAQRETIESEGTYYIGYMQ